jgi:hypothetical protein
VLTAGTQTLSLTFTPTDSTDYTTQTATTTITVSKATPTITWPTPASIAYGTPLSATQLDATASVPGSFVYSPVVGTVLAGGAHTLYATFTPTDTTDYNKVYPTVPLLQCFRSSPHGSNWRDGPTATRVAGKSGSSLPHSFSSFR